MNPTVSDTRTRLQTELPAMLRLLETLVNVDSGSYHVPGVDRVGQILADELDRLGFTIARFPLDARGDQVIASRRFGGQGHLLVLGHIDTVWPEGTVREWPFAARDGRATGPGVGDMKGGLVMALFALRELERQGFEGIESIRFFLVPDEELGSVGSRARIEAEGRTADWVLVLEPGRPGGGVVTGRGALGAFFLDARGRSAHCAVNYDQGASAVRELASVVPELEALSDAARGTVVNVGIFTGGAARQVVPDRARIHVDLRARTQAEAERLVDRIRAIAATRRDPRVTVELTGTLTRPAFPRSAGVQALYALAARVAAELGLPLSEVTTSGGSDGSFTAALGVPTLDGLGPVCRDVCSRTESIEIASLVDRAALFVGVIRELPPLAAR